MKISDPAATPNAAAVTDAPLPLPDQQFTAWVDGQLDGENLARFEREMEENLPELLAERDSALHLGQMLRDHAAPPALSNPDFFTLRLLQRLADEDEQPTPAPAPAESTRSGITPWLRRLLLPTLALAACAQVILLASHFLAPLPPSGPSIAAVANPAPVSTQAPAPSHLALAPSHLALAVSFYNTQATTPNFSAIPVHSAKGNMTVLWLNGLDWIPPETEIK